MLGFTYSFNDQNIDELNVTEVAQQWRENRNVVREIYNSSLEGVLQAIRKAQCKSFQKLMLNIVSAKFKPRETL